MGGPPASALSQPSPDPRRDHRHDHLRSLGVAARPTTLAGDRLIEVPEALRSLLPEGGLRRGSTVTVAAGDGTGATSLALALTVPVTRSGAWVAAVGLGSIGLVAATQLGAVLDRFALVPAAGEQWPVVTAALLDSVDVVLLAPGGRVRAADARRLSARARERGAVLVVLSSAGVRSAGWPEAADVHLAVRRARWEGLRGGAGHLQARTLDVVVTGRRAASLPRQREVWLPGPDGRVEVTSPADRASGGGAGSGGAGGGGAGGGGAGGHAAGSRAVPPGADEGPAAAIALVS